MRWFSVKSYRCTGKLLARAERMIRADKHGLTFNAWYTHHVTTTVRATRNGITRKPLAEFMVKPVSG